MIQRKSEVIPDEFCITEISEGVFRAGKLVYAVYTGLKFIARRLVMKETERF